jgi:hypothetical protein
VVAAPTIAWSRGAEGRATAPPPTKSAGDERAVRPARDAPIDPRHGLLGAPGAAPDPDPASRLGAAAPPSGSYGEAARAGRGSGAISSTWHSGDRVRSADSADVRLARQQEAPDLEFVDGAQGGRSAPQGAAVPPPKVQARKQANGRERR